MQTYYTQLASVVQFFWLNLYCHIGSLLLCAAVCPSAAAVSFLCSGYRLSQDQDITWKNRGCCHKTV